MLKICLRILPVGMLISVMLIKKISVRRKDELLISMPPRTNPLP